MAFADSPLATLVRFELRMLVRDRRTLLASVLLPVLVTPLFFVVSKKVEERRSRRQEAKTFSYAVTGGAAAEARAWLAAFAPAAGTDEEDAPGRLSLAEKEVADPDAALAADDLDLVVRALTAEEAAADPLPADGDEGDDGEEEELGAAPASPADPAEIARLPSLRLVYRGGEDASSSAAREMEARLERVREERRQASLAERGFPVPFEAVAVLVPVDLATAEQRSGATLGRVATFFVMMFLMIGGSVVAADTLAGEKERGTLETMLTTAATRGEIVAAKQIVILIVGIVITLIQALNLLVYVGLEVIDVPEGFRVALGPGTVLLVLVLFLPLAALTASGLLLLSGRAKTYKEFQLHFFPVFLLALAPAAAAFLPGIDLRSAVVLVPIANLAVAVKEVLAGKVDAPFLALAWLVSASAAVLLARATGRALVTERLLVAGEHDRAEHLGGPELFPRRVGRWFAAMWAVVLLVSLNVESLATLERQVLFNVVLVFFGGSLVMMRLYRLDARETLALRPPRPWVWPAVLLAAPASLATTLWLARRLTAVLPVPERLLEEMSKSLVPPDVPLATLVVFLVLIPGAFEELAFRGVLLHGLHRKLRPVALCLVVGAVFGLFHFQLARLIPTALLGVKLAALTLLTGSIFPAMAWHALNNGTAVAITRVAGEETATPFAPWMVAVALAVEVAAWWWIWRSRTPYPGLRTGRDVAAE